MSLKYQAGDDIMLGDLVFFHGEPGEIELLAEPSSTDPEHKWYIEEYGGGVTVREPKHFGRAFIPADQLPETEDLIFVARRDSERAGIEDVQMGTVTLEWLKRAVHDSSELSKQGNNDEALKLLAVSVHTALKANKINWVQTLCSHASAIADSAGDLLSVRRYRGLAVQHAPNAQNLYGWADVLLREGDAETARSMAAKAYDLIRESSDELDRALAELLIKRWPELKITRQE
jgi:hypothetical protein